MATYWITFRLGEVGDYNTRYDNLIEAINSSASLVWEEPTSFLLIESTATIDELAQLLSAQMDTVHDLVLIGNPNVKQARVIGIVEDENLFRLLPFTKYA